MLCDHTTWYPKERPAPTLVTPRATRPVLSTPRPDQCAPHPISGVREELPAVHWPGFAEANRPTPELWPTGRPPKWYIWLTLYPLQGRRCAACRRRRSSITATTPLSSAACSAQPAIPMQPRLIRTTSSNPHRPRSRCALNPHRHEHASHTRNGNTLTQSMCVRGR